MSERFVSQQYEPGECSLALFGGTAYVHECKEASLSNGEVCASLIGELVYTPYVLRMFSLCW